MNLVTINSPATRFKALHIRSTALWEQGQYAEALIEIESMAELYEECDSLSKGKFHGQRGLILRTLKETDRAIVDYTAAIHFFQEAGDVQCQAIASNNLAGVYLETEQFPEAHKYVEQARELFQKLDDQNYEAQAWDQTALIFLAEDKLDEAGEANCRSLALAQVGETLRECQGTAEKIKQASTLKCGDDHAILRATGTLPRLPDLPKLTPGEGDSVMTHLDSALRLIDGNPEKANDLYDLLIFASAGRGDPVHEAARDHIERVVHSFTEPCQEAREHDRKRRLLKLVPTSDCSDA